MPRGVYERTKRSLEDRFWEKVEKQAHGCWLWTGATREGYGRIMLPDQTLVDAHRLSYFMAHGVWPPEDTRHCCHTPACVNPVHLIPGSRAQNMRDMVEAGRSLVGELQPNHKLTWARVRDVRSRHARGASAAALARECGVSERTMRQCLSGETWKIETGER